MIGKILGRAAGLPLRLLTLPVEAGEMVIDTMIGEEGNHLSEDARDAIRKLEKKIEEALDE